MSTFTNKQVHVCERYTLLGDVEELQELDLYFSREVPSVDELKPSYNETIIAALDQTTYTLEAYAKFRITGDSLSVSRFVFSDELYGKWLVHRLLGRLAKIKRNSIDVCVHQADGRLLSFFHEHGFCVNCSTEDEYVMRFNTRS